MTTINEQETYKTIYESRHEPENLRPIAELYWRMMLLSAVVVVALSIGFGIWEFSAVMTTISSASSVSSAPQKPPVDKAALEDAVTQFSQRTADYQYAQGILPTVTDPSK